MEEWKEVIGFEGLYCVSNTGRVKSLKTNKILSPCPNGTGYLVVYLYKDKKRYTKLIHRLVAEQFVYNTNPGIYHIINHKDQTRTNNVFSNLEWCDHEYNSNYGDALQRNGDKHRGHIHTTEARSKMSDAKKGKKYHSRCPVLCIETGIIYETAKCASRMLLCDAHKILDACQGKRDTYRGFHFSYVECSPGRL